MNIGEIVKQADILVPNEVSSADKVLQLNAINQDFFNVVKIPQIAQFSCAAAQSEYTLPPDVRLKNIDKLLVGMFQYQSLDREDVTPAQNAYSFDDQTHTLSLFPAPYTDLQGFLRYRRIGVSVFVPANLAAVPDAPEEYHWTYVPALAAYLAHTQDDSVKAANYESQYKAAWNVAAQNYQAGDSG
ncbi:hypothetical protein AWU65_20425 [Paenibacillus glucanolyticus]|uniref:Uncharacterized protein n=1 Tax=Paenibacillus glucanolyticus TaxID=59843 RepID=A0A163LH00_9BACL|nr:hypothetical protein [Paenibacillus glucanolyticus]KZS48124.1 hypothetical protein AWU65_20425 [Paenibacillus glucanolyticus]